MIIAFFGHSDFLGNDEYEHKILTFLERTAADSPTDIYFGEYGRFDSFAYECCKKYKTLHPNVSLILITPYITLDYQEKQLKHLRCKYDDIIYPDIESKPLRFAISYRNKWMVEKADHIIFAVHRTFGGAYKAYCYAQKKKKPITNIIGSSI